MCIYWFSSESGYRRRQRRKPQYNHYGDISPNNYGELVASCSFVLQFVNSEIIMLCICSFDTSAFSALAVLDDNCRLLYRPKSVYLLIPTRVQIKIMHLSVSVDGLL